VRRWAPFLLLLAFWLVYLWAYRGGGRVGLADLIAAAIMAVLTLGAIRGVRALAMRTRSGRE
jgi:hypothetical protein